MLLQLLKMHSKTLLKYRSGELIYREGANPLFYYEVMNGEVRIGDNDHQTYESCKSIYKANECFGVSSLLCEKPYPSSAFAHTDCGLFILPKRPFLSILKDNYDLHIAITKLLSEQLLFNETKQASINNEESLYELLNVVYNPSR